MQFDLIEDTYVDFEDLANCVYAPWQNPVQFIPVPKVQPQHIVFDKSFASFKAYPETQDNEAKPFTSMSGWFMNMPNIQNVAGFENIYNGITDFSLTFCIFTGRINSDEILDYNNSNDGAVLDLERFKQDNLTNVMGTFSNSSFTKITIPKGFAPKATRFGATLNVPVLGDIYMSLFYGCKASELKILGTIGTGVKDFTGLFSGCVNLKTFDDASMRQIDFSQAENIDMLFEQSGFASITIPDSLKKSSNINSMYRTFAFESVTKEIDLTGLNTSKIEDLSELFIQSLSLTSVNLSGLNFSSVKNMSKMFYSCVSLLSVDLSSLDLSSVENTSYMFSSYSEFAEKGQLTTIKFPKEPNKIFKSLKNTEGMFGRCIALHTIDSIN